ncbi:DegT/DnrJ/EryC1/StrS family aminotransferase [Pelagicoccus albus]|uniref:Aminotransferase class I/II-fold pyridoxal phosphate-dependent enzyme n=1 Tax=Pelagicoccus albus TaxID=415222 RepID=A0A7X1B670_9BACT|nr:aminotransferase class I/II-fold pyridoxal phosphate-dependent enzyme [Pelagicoccus albus]MBC2606272.1 aminotransferase class I/II-fold pyridoxal phosphate-dependent enzyme [Pelagicoccus albus]
MSYSLHESPIPVMKPLLPTADLITPYLEQIDENRWYSNFGPLVTQLESRLEKHFGVEEGTVALVSSATSGIVMAMRTLSVPRGSYCALPAWTFAATPAAVYNADMVPFFVDVDEDTWAVDPESLLQIREKISAVVPVAPFGTPLDMDHWESFQARTGLPIVVDAASCFDSFARVDSFRISEIPVILSLHATKTFGCGEGGLIICKNKDFIKRIKDLSNFGFTDEEMYARGENAKMSEYTAAVGLAELDNWENKRAHYQELSDLYSKYLGNIGLQNWRSGDWISSTSIVRLPFDRVEDVVNILKSKGIETRRWWRRGCHHFQAYSEFPRLPLITTEVLVNSALGLPNWIGMTEEHVKRVISGLCEAIQATDPSRAVSISPKSEAKA